MKLPKHRANVFLVERNMVTPEEYYLGKWTSTVVVGVFATHEGAEDFAGACTQEFIEKGYDSAMYSFETKMSTYYDQ